MKKSLLFLFAVLFLFSACDEATELPKPEKKYYLTRKVSEIVSPTGSTQVIDLNYHYNKNNQLVSITGTSPNFTQANPVNIVYTYDDKNRLVHIQNTPELSWTITYNDRNQVDKQIRTYINPDKTTSTHYYQNKYNSEGKRISLQIRNIINGVDTPGPTYTYTYTGGLVTFMKGELPTGGKYNDFSFAYDDKKVPLPGVYQLSVPTFYVQEIPNQLLADHNYISFSRSSSDKTLDYSFEATYTYNEAGYPLTSVRMFQEGSVERITYTYLEETAPL